MKMRILVIEDEPQIVELLLNATKNYTTFFASTGELVEALKMCSAEEWDCIIVDLKLLDSSVEQTLAKLRAIKKMQPNSGMIVCSGMPVPRLKERCLEAGADSFVPKNRAFLEEAQELIIAINVGMMHVSPHNKPDSFMPSVRTLREMAEKKN